ncbi:hypothetical protein QUF76_17855 [Desulfobacterales bacterium HSG16]|nr:hypothetical protein [Desulfobacterales bacterium HSG16]
MDALINLITTHYVIVTGLFVLAASCYLLFIVSDPLEDVGGRIGRLLRLPEDVVASTFQALATSGPEIVMAILAATPFIAGEAWQMLETGEKACSGTLNMAFSAMDNLLGIGAVAIVFMIRTKKVDPDAHIPAKPSTVIGLLFYIVSSGLLAIFINDRILTETESWVLMGIGIAFILSQFIIPNLITKYFPEEESMDDENDDDSEEVAIPSLRTAPIAWTKEFFINGFTYAFLVFALIIFVRESMGATFNMASTGLISVGGILIMFTSYVSSFPEFMMAFRYTMADKQNALLGMLFGSNVIDLAFAGFRAIWLHEPMSVYTTGPYPNLLPYYIWTLPAIAALLLLGFSTRTIKWKYAYPMVVFYLVYIISGFRLL